jgi:hypothetical protein
MAEEEKTTMTILHTLSKDERQKLMAGYTHPNIIAHYNQMELSGCYDRDHTIDGCCEAKKEEKKKTEQARLNKEKQDKGEMTTLQERNQLLERWARDVETKQKKMEADIAKMANLISQLISK